jgi:hypothetical protein
MVDLTVDVQVFMSAMALGALEHHQESNALLQEVLATEGCKLALDSEDLIRSRYESKCRNSDLARYWLAEMASRDKIAYVKRARLERGARVALTEAGFVGEDLGQVARTAAATESGICVAHEPHFRAARGLLKKHLGVIVVTAAKARELIRERCGEQGAADGS